MTVAELLGRMSAREMAEWEAYFRLEAEEARGHRVTDEAEMMDVFRRLSAHDSQP